MFKELVKQGLVTEKIFSDYPELRMYKYHRKVFYKNLWNTDKKLLQARGSILDKNGNWVVRPLPKFFNYGENDAGIETSDDEIVTAITKINGFMAAFTLYNDEVLVSTTGSLSSPFTELAKKYADFKVIRGGLKVKQELMEEPVTLICEICCPEDPHIIGENYDCYFLAFVGHETGKVKFITSSQVRSPARIMTTFKNVKETLKYCYHEGFIIIRENGEIFKMKSPYYLTTKFIARMNDSKIDLMFENSLKLKQDIYEEAYNLIDHIVMKFTKDQWKTKTEQERIEYVREWYSKAL